jgi:hypothetical protein
MSGTFKRNIRLEVMVDASDPKLLEGLEAWYNLGLISEGQIKYLSQKYLICNVPETQVIRNIPQVDLPHPEIIPPSPPKRPGLVTQIWQSFRDELSVRWLLFLGVFLVIASSGVFAATVWQWLPAALQYSFLWVYTLVFWGLGFRFSKDENLRLTSQTLQTIGILLIPVNFWAIDTFNLWNNPLEWLTVAIATVSLTQVSLLHNQSRSLLLLNFLGLSYLHCGWQLPVMALIAVYCAMIGSGIILRFLLPRNQEKTNLIGTGFIVYSLAILLIRAIFVVNIPLGQLGLALGICGWLFVGEGLVNKKLNVVNNFQIIGIILLALGWLVSVEEYPWQAIAVSGLALHFCSQRLRKYWLRRDLLATFGIGLQALILIRELIPNQVKQDALNLSVEIANSQAYPFTVYGITLFPYLLFFVWLTGWLYQQEKVKLARFGDGLNFGLGVGLMLISLLNPMWRSLNLFLSSFTLVYVIYHRLPIKPFWIYLTHLLGLLTIGSMINWYDPNFSQLSWSIGVLIIMIIEWVINILPVQESDDFQKIWHQSCWYFGLGLAALSYYLMVELPPTIKTEGSLVWSITPIALTLIASISRTPKRETVALISTVCLIFSQNLTLFNPETRLINLAIATGLMCFNSYFFIDFFTAFVHVGFSLSLIIAFSIGKLTDYNWFILGAILVAILWTIHEFLAKQENNLAKNYARVTNIYGTVFWNILSFLLTINLIFGSLILPAYQSVLLPAIILTLSIGYRCWKRPHNLLIYGLAWNLEITLAEGILFWKPSLELLATANIILSLIALGITSWILKRESRFSSLNSLKILPLFYASLGFLISINSFTAYTGLLTLGVAITGIGVGSRGQNWQPIRYLSLLLISLGCYQLVIYQMLQAFGGSTADGLTILAIVAATIALFYRLFASFLYLRNKTSFLKFTSGEIKFFGHLHWAVASIIKIFAGVIALESESKLTMVSIAVSFLLAAYAILQARDTDETRIKASSDWWVYVGLVEIVATIVYASFVWKQFAVLSPLRIVIASLIAFIIYQLPWQDWGWRSTPWNRSALVIPGLMILVNPNDVSYLSLFAVAVFYGRIAWQQKNIRWSYISLGFLDWAIIQFALEKEFNEVLLFNGLIGLSILYIAQFDSDLTIPQKRKNRHQIRVFGSGFICLTALLFYQDYEIIPPIVSLVFVVAGLGLQVRAFLFVGTINFVLTIFYQLVVLIFEYPFSKWIIGLITGIGLITVAANFERRRDKIKLMLQNWSDQLNRWE